MVAGLLVSVEDQRFRGVTCSKESFCLLEDTGRGGPHPKKTLFIAHDEIAIFPSHTCYDMVKGGTLKRFDFDHMGWVVWFFRIACLTGIVFQWNKLSNFTISPTCQKCALEVSCNLWNGWGVLGRIRVRFPEFFGVAIRKNKRLWAGFAEGEQTFIPKFRGFQKHQSIIGSSFTMLAAKQNCSWASSRWVADKHRGNEGSIDNAELCDILGIIGSYDHKQTSNLMVHVTPWVLETAIHPLDVSFSRRGVWERLQPEGHDMAVREVIIGLESEFASE